MKTHLVLFIDVIK